MSTLALTRDVAAVVAAVGVVAVLDPIPRLPGRPALRRGAGLAATVAGGAVLLGTLVPARAVEAAVASPARVGAALAAVIVGLALAYLGARALLARPWLWFVLLGLALPIRVPVSVGDEDASLLVPLYLAIGLGLAAWVLGRATGRLAPGEDPRTPVDLPLAAFAAFLLISITWSADPVEGAVKGACFYVPFVLLYLLVVAWWPRARAGLRGGGGLVALALTTIALAVPVAVFAVWQYLAETIFWNATLQQANVYSRFFRVNAIFFDPNILGRFLVLALLALLALALVARRPRELAALGVGAAVISAGLLVTFSRSSALMLMVGVVALAAWAFGMRRTLAVGGGLLAVVAIAAVVVNQPVREAATSAERLERVSEGRFDLARGGLTIWRDAPVAGAGLGGFADRFEQTLTPVEQRRTRVLISHNAPVTVLSEGGLAGFALFLALLGAAALAIGRGVPGAGRAGLARWTLLAALAGIVMHSLFYSALFEDPYTWVMAGAALAIGAAARAPGAASLSVAQTPAPSTALGRPVRAVHGAQMARRRLRQTQAPSTALGRPVRAVHGAQVARRRLRQTQAPSTARERPVRAVRGAQIARRLLRRAPARPVTVP